MAKKSMKRPTVEQMFKSVPHRNAAMRVEIREDGTALVSVPIRRPRYMIPPLSWLLPFSGKRRIELDTLGASVLDMCDGETTVEKMITRFAATHKLSFREAQAPVVQFLKMLTQRGVIAIVSS